MFLKFFRKKSGEAEKKDARLVHGIDREMSYCPSCGDEYVPGTTACATCRVGLISGEERLRRLMAEKEPAASRSMAISPEDELVSVRQGTLADMKRLRRVLAAGCVPALIAGDENCGRGCCGGPQLFLQIKRADVDLALKILAEDFIKSTALDSHDLGHAQAVFDHQAAQTVCPACGCRFSPTVGACPDCGLSFE